MRTVQWKFRDEVILDGGVSGGDDVTGGGQVVDGGGVGDGFVV